jgi:hypothetical protein
LDLLSSITDNYIEFNNKKGLAQNIAQLKGDVIHGTTECTVKRRYNSCHYNTLASYPSHEYLSKNA